MDAFVEACDRLSQVVDAIQFERLRWARTEAPMLAHLVELLLEAVEPRKDFELSEEASTQAVRRYVLKVHGNRIAAFTIGLEKTTVSMGAEAINRSRYKVSEADPVSAEYAAIDLAWMTAALSQLIGRITD